MSSIIVGNVQGPGEDNRIDEARGVYVRRAVASIEESLDVWLEMGNQVNAASSYFQLGQLQRTLLHFVWMVRDESRRGPVPTPTECRDVSAQHAVFRSKSRSVVVAGPVGAVERWRGGVGGSFPRLP